MNSAKVGQLIDYRPKVLDTDPEVKGVKVTRFEPAGEIFNQPMITVDEVPHWIPAYDCVPHVPEESPSVHRDLLRRAADSLQEYCGDVNGDMNDSLAMEIYKYLEDTEA